MYSLLTVFIRLIDSSMVGTLYPSILYRLTVTGNLNGKIDFITQQTNEAHQENVKLLNRT